VRMRRRGHRYKMKEVNVQSVSDACQLIMQKSHSQPDAHTAIDGLIRRHMCSLLETATPGCTSRKKEGRIGDVLGIAYCAMLAVFA
jgi:hypothetical protein